MDEDDIELIARLCTKIGTIMEDASAGAITISGLEPDCVPEVLAELRMASRTIAALVDAATAITSAKI